MFTDQQRTFMQKFLTLSLLIILSENSLLAAEQKDKKTPLFTPKECCILAAWLAADASAKAYEYYQKPTINLSHKPPTTKKML